MKTRKNKAPFATTETSGTETPIKPKRLTAEAALNAEFDVFCQARFPQEYAEEDDRKILRAVWMASAMQTCAQLIKGSLEPLHQTARAQFELASQPLPPVTA